jgi:hypothetical protein
MSRIDVTVGVKNAAFKSGLDEVRQSAKRFTDDIKQSFAGMFAAAAVVNGINQIITQGARIGDLAQQFRVPAEELQRLAMAGELSGTGMEVVARSMNKLRLAQADAIQGNASLRETFDQVGISVSELSGMGAEALYYRVSDAVAGATTETEKLTIAGSLFGDRLAGQLIPMLDQGGEAMRELGDKAGVMSQETINALSQADDTIQELKQTLTVALGTVVGTVIMPLIKGVKTMGAVLGGEFYFLSTVVGEFGSILGRALSGDFSGAMQQAKQFGKVMSEAAVTAAQSVVAEVGEIWTEPPTKSSARGDQATLTEKAKEPSADLEKQLAEQRAQNDREQMDRQARINAMQSDYNRLLSEAESLTGDDHIKKQLEAEKLKGQLNRELKSQREEEIRDRERIEQVAQRQAERWKEQLAQAKTAEANVDEENLLRGMNKEDKRDYLENKQSRLTQESTSALAQGDEVTAVQKRTEAKKLQGEIEQMSTPKTDSASRVATVSSLQRIGGGGNIGGLGDPAQRERERQTALLERIAKSLDTKTTTSTSLTATLAP